MLGRKRWPSRRTQMATRTAPKPASWQFESVANPFWRHDKVNDTTELIGD